MIYRLCQSNVELSKHQAETLCGILCCCWGCGRRRDDRRLAYTARLSVSCQSLCSLHLPHGRIPAGQSQETDVDRGSATVRVCYAHVSCLACLSISMFCRRYGWALDFKDMCHAIEAEDCSVTCMCGGRCSTGKQCTRGVERAFVADIVRSVSAPIL